jgi:hypothetical protein
MKNKDGWFMIKDFDDFVNNARALVFKYFGDTESTPVDPLSISIIKMNPQEKKELDETLTHEECALIIKGYAKIQKTKNNKIKYCLNDKILLQILEDMNSRLVSNILNSLVNKGVLDSAFDSEKNDFVFWVKDDQENNQKPETD